MKKVCNCWYVHKSNINELLDNISFIRLGDVLNALKEIDELMFEYDVVKYDKANHSITFIQSPDWDTANEPEVGDGMKIDMADMCKWKLIPARKKNKQIYHSKWMFVADDYDGFDIDKAKARTKEWSAIPNLDKKRIGNKDFWLKTLKENYICE